MTFRTRRGRDSKALATLARPRSRVGHRPSRQRTSLADEGVVVIDAGQNPIESRDIMDTVKKLTSMPVRLVIDTEPHGAKGPATRGLFVISSRRRDSLSAHLKLSRNSGEGRRLFAAMSGTCRMPQRWISVREVFPHGLTPPRRLGPQTPRWRRGFRLPFASAARAVRRGLATRIAGQMQPLDFRAWLPSNTPPAVHEKISSRTALLFSSSSGRYFGPRSCGIFRRSMMRIATCIQTRAIATRANSSMKQLVQTLSKSFMKPKAIGSTKPATYPGYSHARTEVRTPREILILAQTSCPRAG